jgi:hypothetical protein
VIHALDFYIDVEDGKARIMDCETCELPQPESCEFCPLVTGEQPQNQPDVEFYIQLWQRVKRYGHLPDPGGMLDQEERLMKVMDAVNAHVDRRNHEKAEAERRRQMQESNRLGTFRR